jgi:hypothetical protein
MNDVLDILLHAVATAALGLGGVAVHRLSDWLRLRADDQVRGYLLQVVATAVEYGQAEARRRILASVGDIPRERQANIAAELARDYVRSRVPDALDRFGIDTAGLDLMVRARMPAPRPVVGG